MPSFAPELLYFLTYGMIYDLGMEYYPPRVLRDFDSVPGENSLMRTDFMSPSQTVLTR